MPPQISEEYEKAYKKEFTPDTRRSAWLMLKNIFRHPGLFSRTLRKHDNLENHFDEYAPRVSFGRSDHPLDDLGPMSSPFTAIPKLYFRKSESVLSVHLKEKQGNRFVFEARTFNIFKLIKPDSFYKHVYEYHEKTPYKIRHLCIDILREDAYRVRLQPSPEFDDIYTPMVVNDIEDETCQVNLEEDEVCYRLKTKKLALHICKNDFRIELYDAAGNRITRSGGRTDNGFGVAFDAYPLGFIKDKRHRRWYAVESFELSHDESIYGLGEHFGRINKVGETLRLWIHEGTGNTSGRIYKSVPFYMSTRGYGVFFNQTHPMTFWVGTKEKSKVYR
ncbi:MAG: alpha-glucosidase domain-containing protein [Dehalococcoidia bacterium]